MATTRLGPARPRPVWLPGRPGPASRRPPRDHPSALPQQSRRLLVARRAAPAPRADPQHPADRDCDCRPTRRGAEQLQPQVQQQRWRGAAARRRGRSRARQNGWLPGLLLARSSGLALSPTPTPHPYTPPLRPTPAPPQPQLDHRGLGGSRRPVVRCEISVPEVIQTYNRSRFLSSVETRIMIHTQMEVIGMILAK